MTSFSRLRSFLHAVLRRSRMDARRDAAAVGRLLESGLTLDTGERDEQTSPRRNAVGPGFFRTIGEKIPLRSSALRRT